VDGITVTGTAGVEARHDRAVVHLGVAAEAATAAEAMAVLESRVRAVTGALRGRGLGDADIRTTNLSVGQPYGPSGTPSGYVASSETAATIRELEAVGAVLDAVITAGATRLDGLSMELSDDSGPYAEALVLAIEAARAKAEVLARAAGLVLGEILAVTEGSGGAHTVMWAEARSPGMPVEPGRAMVTATVTVRFATSPGSPARP